MKPLDLKQKEEKMTMMKMVNEGCDDVKPDKEDDDDDDNDDNDEEEEE